MTDWIRTTKANRCPVCQKDSWCIINSKAGIVICMRETSPRMKTMMGGEVGWIHPLDPNVKPKTSLDPRVQDLPTINSRQLIETWKKATDPAWVVKLSAQLGVRPSSLMCLDTCWSAEHRAWAFPMRDGYNNMVGIRLRSETGDKFAVRGSHNGCFIPQTSNSQPLALVAEGPTDTCAGLDMGFYTVGRPSCSGGMDQLKHLFNRIGVRRAAIICDNDEPGIRGAQMLATHIGVGSCLVVLPTKDLREFVRSGGDSELMTTYIETSVWRSE